MPALASRRSGDLRGADRARPLDALVVTPAPEARLDAPQRSMPPASASAGASAIGRTRATSAAIRAATYPGDAGAASKLPSSSTRTSVRWIQAARHQGDSNNHTRAQLRMSFDGDASGVGSIRHDGDAPRLVHEPTRDHRSAKSASGSGKSLPSRAR